MNSLPLLPAPPEVNSISLVPLAGGEVTMVIEPRPAYWGKKYLKFPSTKKAGSYVKAFYPAFYSKLGGAK